MNICLLVELTFGGEHSSGRRGQVVKRWKAHTKVLVSTYMLTVAFRSMNHSDEEYRNFTLYSEGIQTGNWGPRSNWFWLLPSEVPLLTFCICRALAYLSTRAVLEGRAQARVHRVQTSTSHRAHHHKWQSIVSLRYTLNSVISTPIMSLIVHPQLLVWVQSSGSFQVLVANCR